MLQKSNEVNMILWSKQKTNTDWIWWKIATINIQNQYASSQIVMPWILSRLLNSICLLILVCTYSRLVSIPSLILCPYAEGAYGN